MGYSHCFKRAKELDADLFNKFVSDCKLIINKSGLVLVDGEISNITHEVIVDKLPRLSENMVRFTEVGGYDRFKIRRVFEPAEWMKPENGLYFQCIKTCRQEYDIVVVACLLAFKYYFPESIIYSDGFPAELVDGQNLYREATNNVGPLLILEGGCTHLK